MANEKNQNQPQGQPAQAQTVECHNDHCQVTCQVPGDVLHRAQCCGFDPSKILQLIQQYGPVVVSVLAQLLSMLPHQDQPQAQAHQGT